MKCPILRAVDVFRWIKKGILPFERLNSDSAILKLIAGKTVRRTWFSRTKAGKIKKRTRTQYLRKGIFLIPITMEVPDWEIIMLKDNGMVPEPLGIFRFNDGYRRLCYMKVSSLDHAIRQQNHVLDQYLATANFELGQMIEVVGDIEKIAKIVEVVDIRRFDLNMFYYFAKKSLESHRAQLQSFIDYAPLFTGKGQVTLAGKTAIVRALTLMIKDCERFNFRPIYRKIQVAVRALTSARDYLNVNDIRHAKSHIAFAITQMKYPETKNPDSEPVPSH